jgi:predicted DNA-binding WGR domain protein
MAEPLPSCICLASVDPSKNRYRLYRLSWQPSLWGEGALVRWWGRKGARGRTRVSWYPTAEDAQDEFARLLRLRTRHGYRLLR